MISGSGYNSLELGTYSNFKMSVDLEPDFYAKKLNAKVFSDKKVFYSSDETIAKIDKRGNITTFEKEGTCYIHLRAHNGVSGKVKINVVNYAQPKSFPEYNGDNKFVNLLLTDYKNEVFNITNYFTRFGKNTIVGKIKSDDNGNIVGDSNIINNSQLSSSIKKLITDFPMVMQIEYRDRWVRFYMPYSDSGAYIEVIYSADEDFSESHHRIAPHWKEYNFIPK